MKEIIERSMQLVSLVQRMEAFGYPFEVAVTPIKDIRNAEQNRFMWASLTDVSKQVIWYGKKLSPEDWKDVFTASLENLTVVPNLEGTGFVALGGKTSRMSKKRFAELCDLIIAFGDDNNVRWSNPNDILNYMEKKENEKND